MRDRLRSSPRYGSSGGGASSRIDMAASQSIAGIGSRCAARSGALSRMSRRNAFSSANVQQAASFVIVRPSTIAAACGNGRARGAA